MVSGRKKRGPLTSDERIGHFIRLGESLKWLLQHQGYVGDISQAPVATAGEALSCLGNSFHRAQRLWPSDANGIIERIRGLHDDVLSYGSKKKLPPKFFTGVEDLYSDLCELYTYEFHTEPALGWLLKWPAPSIEDQAQAEQETPS